MTDYKKKERGGGGGNENGRIFGDHVSSSGDRTSRISSILEREAGDGREGEDGDNCDNGIIATPLFVISNVKINNFLMNNY